MQPIPEDKMRRAEQQQNSSGLFVPAAEAFQASHADEDEQTSQGRNVVGVEIGIEIRSQAEQEDRQENPSESVCPRKRSRKRGCADKAVRERRNDRSGCRLAQRCQ